MAGSGLRLTTHLEMAEMQDSYKWQIQAKNAAYLGKRLPKWRPEVSRRFYWLLRAGDVSERRVVTLEALPFFGSLNGGNVRLQMGTAQQRAPTTHFKNSGQILHFSNV